MELANESGKTFKLPTSNSVQIISTQVENQPAYQVLKKYFEKDGFEFINSRAQVFITYSQENSSPSMFVIIPSLVPVDFTKDPSHKAVGIVAFINKDQHAFLATEVLVNHKPFQIENYTLFSLNEKKGVDAILTVSKKDLASSDIGAISQRIKDTKINAKGIINAGIPQEDFGYIITSSLSSFLNDQYNRSSPADYKSKMMVESSLIEKFSLAIAMRKQASLAKMSYCCSCTCCNGCTTTSTSISVNMSAA